MSLFYNVVLSLQMISLDPWIAFGNAIMDIIKHTRLDLLKLITASASKDKNAFLQHKTDFSAAYGTFSREQWNAINLVLMFGGHKRTPFARVLCVQQKLR